VLVKWFTLGHFGSFVWRDAKAAMIAPNRQNWFFWRGADCSLHRISVSFKNISSL
jgi:hypothetical protein